LFRRWIVMASFPALHHDFVAEILILLLSS
jgi:hypothetical protein